MELKEMLEELRVGELGGKIRELFPKLPLSLDEMLDMLFHGRILELGKALLCEGVLGAWGRTQDAKKLLVALLLLGVISAMVMHFSDLLDGFQVRELCFYFTFLLQAAILTRCFLALIRVAEGALDGICLFVRLLMPTYLFAVGMSTGSITAGASHQMALLVISAVEEVLRGSFLPIVKCYFLMTVLEGIQSWEQMDALLELVKKGIRWGLKGAIWIVAGLSFLQSVLTPALDKMSGSVAKKIMGAIPWVGDGAEGVLELVMGSAMVVKGSMGVLLMLLLLLLCLSPLFELLLYSVMMKLAAAVTGIVGDKRMTKGLDRAGEAGLLLLGVSGTGMLLFLMTIAATCIAVR